ncbi:MAG: hypothetical protein KUG74_06555 [Rhodobacteraceae bacterium]|nr:hypothetical protein [Paracoccaceae bacterium]
MTTPLKIENLTEQIKITAFFVKYSIRNLSFSIAAVVLTSMPALAQNIGGLGVQYDRMPVGTKVYYESNDDDSWMDVFVGKEKGKYVVRRYNGKSLKGRVRSERVFEANGRLISLTGYGERAERYKLTFKPYLCEFQLGDCKIKRSFRGSAYIEDGSSESWGANTKKASGGYRTTYFKIKKDTIVGLQFFKMGKYNLRSLSEWGSGKSKTTTKIISIK